MGNTAAIEKLKRQVDETSAALSDVESQTRLLKKRLRWAKVRAIYFRSAEELRKPATTYSLWNLGVHIVGAAMGAAVFFTLLYLLGAPAGLLVLGTFVGAACAFGAVAIMLRHPATESLPSLLAEARSAIEQLKAELIPLNTKKDHLRTEITSARSAITELIDSERRERERLLQRDWKTMREAEWVPYVAEVCQFLGAHVKHTASSEHGVDLIVKYGRYRIAVRAKGYQHRVNNKPVEEVLAGMSHYECNRAAVITNSRFTKYAQEFAAEHSCILIGEREFEAFVMGSNLELFY